jgi:hypothetical protein
MPTREEIERRVQQNDTPLSAKRSTAAQQIGELAQRRTEIAEQLGEVERQLGDVLADASAVMDIDELARFTDVPAVDLTRWLTARTTTRSKRKKPSGATQNGKSRGRAADRTLAAGQAPTQQEHSVLRDGVPDTPARVSATVS